MMPKYLKCLLLSVIVSCCSALEKQRCSLKANMVSTSSVVVNLHENIVLNCSSFGNSTSKVEWRKEGQLVNTTMSVLSKKNVTKDDAGQYECTLRKGNNITEYCSVIVRVNFPPITRVPFCEELHGTLEVRCIISAYPKPNITWFKDGKLLNFSKTGYFVKESSNDERHISVLEKYHPTRGVLGNYTCVAENMYGRSSDSISKRLRGCINTGLKCARFADVQMRRTVFLTVGQTKSLLCKILYFYEPSSLDVRDFDKTHQNGKGSNNNEVTYIYQNQTLILNYTIINATKNNSGDYRCRYYGEQNPKCNILMTYFHVIVKDRELLQFPQKSPKNIYTAAAVSVAGGVLGLVLFVFVYWLRKKKRSHLTLHESSPELQWDVFVSYSSGDFEWVKELCKILEEPPFDLSVCIHQRDWEIGRAIVDNMVDSVYCSQKSLIIMSKSYFKSPYCMQELQIAMHSELDDLQQKKIVLVKIDDVPLNKLPRALRQRCYLDFSDSKQRKHFKAKLLRALPKRQCSNDCNNDSLDQDRNQNFRLEEVSA